MEVETQEEGKFQIEKGENFMFKKDEIVTPQEVLTSPKYTGVDMGKYGTQIEQEQEIWKKETVTQENKEDHFNGKSYNDSHAEAKSKIERQDAIRPVSYTHLTLPTKA